MIDSVSEKAGPDLKKTKRTKGTQGAMVDRLPPHSPEAEQGVLGCCLLSPQECVGKCITKFKAGADVFYDLRHQTIYSVMAEMFDAHETIDVITLQQKLKDRQLLEEVGGIPYLNALQDAVPSAANLEYYADIVLEKHVLRRYVQVCTETVGRIYDFEGEVDALCDSVEKDILAVADVKENQTAETYQTLVPASIDIIEACFQQQGVPSGLPTGFVDLDKMTDGLHAGEMIVIAGRPSTGKTSLAMNIAEHVAVNGGNAVAVFSLEMTAESLTTRAICSLARVSLRKIKDGFMAETDFSKIANAAGKMKDAPVYIDDSAGLSVMQLRSRARRLWQQFGIKLFVIDYLQLMHSTSRKAQENRVQEVSEISSGLKALAKECSVPVMVLSQLNRELEKRNPGSKPRLSDLRESGAIEQDADVVGLLYRPNAEQEEGEWNEKPEDAGYAVNLLIAKQRNGPTGDVKLTFLKEFTRFETAAKIVDADLPYKDN